MDVYATDPKKNRRIRIGDFDEYYNVLTLRKKPEHFMTIMDGYGMQQDIYENALKRGCGVKIIVGGEMYTSDIQTWSEYGITRNFGHGDQRFLSVKHMNKL